MLKFIADADFNLLLYSMEHGSILVTDETDKDNDKKAFHKITRISRMEGVHTISTSEYLKRIGIEASFSRRVKSST